MARSMTTKLVTLCFSLVSASYTCAATPETFVKLDDDTLRVTAGHAVRVTLQIPGGEAWSQANIGQLQLRTFGRVENISPAEDEASHQLNFTIDDPGYAMLILAVGPGSTKSKTDSVTHTPYCAKLLLRVDAASTAASPSSNDKLAPGVLKSPGMMAKVGMKVEVSPFIDPLSLSAHDVRIGADLPVRVYYEGSSQKQVSVTAYSPDGTPQRQTTDGVGSARFRIDQIGRWLIRYQHVADGITYTGDLVFEAGVDPPGEKP